MDRNTVSLADAHHEAGIATDEAMATGPRPGTYARGTETVDAILKAAHDVLIEEGASAFTIRRIANASGMKVGNVSYHFPRKEMLIKIMLDELLDSYDKLLESEVRQPAISPEDRLRLIVKLCLDDIAGKRTTRLFTELWALANHNTFVAERVRAFYQRVHDFIGEVVTALNPALSPDEVQTVALYISASMEGTTPFLGFEKPWAAKMPQITAIAAEAMVSLVKAIRPEQLEPVR
ncbi:TetR/AcrR family transcriptional regulator [Novosphingobium sp.]|uniref:TetR/AcrR family transcriptional regulator n=1 Tax=Novosphingobium sp. TaxID=1874826 RepID=UPI003BAB8F1C